MKSNDDDVVSNDEMMINVEKQNYDDGDDVNDVDGDDDAGQ